MPLPYFDSGLELSESDDIKESTASGNPHLGPALGIRLLQEGFALGDWEGILSYMGGLLQDFRLRSKPDYQDVKEHLMARSRQGGQFMQNTPSRATFGMPLTFRYSSIRGDVTFLPYDERVKGAFERHGSLLHLRTAVIGDRLYPLFIRLDGDVPGIAPRGAIRGQGRPLRRPKENSMDRFLNSLAGQ